MIEFRWINPAHLHADWPLIRTSLEAVKAKCGNRWIPEDVYHLLKTNHSVLHMAYEAGEYAGLIVTTKTACEFSGEPELHVWIAHNVGDRNVIESGMEFLRQMARSAGVTRVTFDSPRLGWSKVHELESATYRVRL